MDVELFVDTNILVYAYSRSSPFEVAARLRLAHFAGLGTSMGLPVQVLKEFCMTMSRDKMLVRPADTVAITRLARDILTNFAVLAETSASASILLDLIAKYHLRGRGIYDAAIVATMQAHGVPALLTHNTSDFLRFTDLIEVIPLVP